MSRVEFDTAHDGLSDQPLAEGVGRSDGAQAHGARVAPVAAGRFEGSPRLAQCPSTANAIASSASLGTPCASVVSSCAGATRAESARTSVGLRAPPPHRIQRSGGAGKKRSAARATLSTVSCSEAREHVVRRAAARQHRVARAREERLAEVLVPGALGRRAREVRIGEPLLQQLTAARARARRARRRGRSARALRSPSAPRGRAARCRAPGRTRSRARGRGRADSSRW